MNMASIAGRQPTRFGPILGSRGGAARGSIGGGGTADEARLERSMSDMHSHLPVLFVVGGLVSSRACQLLIIACTSRLRRSWGDNWHWHNVMVVTTSIVVVVVVIVIIVVVVVEERHCIVRVMGWCWFWKL